MNLYLQYCYLSLGAVDSSTVEKVEVVITDAEKDRLARVEARPPLSEILNLHDFEVNFKSYFFCHILFTTLYRPLHDL